VVLGGNTLEDQLYGVLLGSGYSAGQLRRDEDVWTPKRGAVKSSVVGFARMHGPFDTSTATLVGGAAARSSDVEAVLTEAAISLAAPIVLLAEQSHVTLRSINADGVALYEEEFDWVEAERGFRGFLEPRALLAAKLGQRQRTLFPVDATLLAHARDLTEDALGPRVATLLAASANVLARQPGQDGRSEQHARAARLVIGALTTVVLRDKELDGLDLPSSALFDIALQRHPAQFRWASNLALWETQVLEELIDDLSDVDFSFAEPVLLSRIYESRLVDDAARRSLGAHYTPPQLAEQMLRYMPIEELDPSHRKVLDPTCGSGTLLLAAHDRLAGLQPEDWSPSVAHRDLVDRLHGTDIDPVAVEIANLSLLLHALPAGNGWRVAEGDARRPSPRAEFDIVVANPPWQWSNKGKQTDVAHDFLEKMLRRLRPDGLLGVVLPVAWLTRNSSRESRALVRRQCDIFEIWRLPPGTFEGADSGAAVILARKKPARTSRPKPFIIREVTHARDLEAFYNQGVCDVALLSSPTDEALASGPLSRWWAANRQTTLTVGDYAETVSGPQPASPEELYERGVDLDAPNAYFLPEPGRIARFAEIQATDLIPITFPEGMQKGSSRGGKGLGRPKVLVGAAMSPANPWRLRVAMDQTGALPRNTATMVIPRADGSLTLSEEEIRFGLLAYLGSGFASAFIADTVQTRKIGAPQIRSLPAPDPQVLGSLGTIGRSLSAAATVGDSTRVGELRAILEKLVWAWSGVPDGLQQGIVNRMTPTAVSLNSALPVAPAMSKATSSVEAWVRSGSVVEADVRRGLRLVIDGLTGEDGEWTAIPQSFPGAVARPGMNFLVRIPSGSSLQSADFSFDEFAYLDADSVSRLLADESFSALSDSMSD
jgi:SAM-dependent methyltransferase